MKLFIISHLWYRKRRWHSKKRLWASSSSYVFLAPPARYPAIFLPPSSEGRPVPTLFVQTAIFYSERSQRKGAWLKGSPSAQTMNGARTPRRPCRRWWNQRDSNPRPPACKAGALPTELWSHMRPNTGMLHRESFRPRGFTFRLCIQPWSEWQGSNLRHHGPKPCALPAELHPDVAAVTAAF